MLLKQFLLALPVMALFYFAGAQEKLSLTLGEAKEYALNYNKTVKNSGLAVDKSQEAIWAAIAAGLPQVNAKADYSNALGAEISIQFNENLPPSKIPIKPTSNFNLQVGQLIFNGTYLTGIQLAKIAQKLSEKNLVKTEQEILSQVTQSYYLVLVSGESLKILMNNIANLKEIYQKTEPLVRVGMMEKVELDQLLVQVNSLDNAVKAAERQHEMAINLLRFQLGVSAETEIELVQTLPEILQKNNLTENTADFEPSQNINFQMLTVQEEIAAKQVQLQKAGYLPSITGFYNYTKKILKPAFDMSPKHMVGVQLNIPVFSSGERYSKVQQAKIDLETMKNNKALMEEQLDIQFRQLTFNLNNAIESYHTQQKNVEVSREVYKNLQRKYEQGMISSLQLTTADSNYLKAESDYLMSVLQVLQDLNALDTLTGNIANN